MSKLHQILDDLPSLKLALVVGPDLIATVPAGLGDVGLQQGDALSAPCPQLGFSMTLPWR